MTVLRATTHLADGANQLFDAWIAELQDLGFDIARAAADDGVLDADVVFACGLLTSVRVQEGQRLTVVAAPIFDGETEATYRSVIVARRDSGIDGLVPDAQLRLAVNEFDSWSGWHGLNEHLRTTDVPASAIGQHVMTGGHVGSIEAVLDGRADIASIDHSVWDARRTVDARLADMSVIDSTRSWPAPPVSLRATLPADIQSRLREAVVSLPGLSPANLADYDFMLDEAERDPNATS